MTGAFAAVDLGPELTRIVVGRLDGGRLSLRETCRFATRTLRLEGTLRWDVLRLYRETLAGLGAAARDASGLTSVAIDGWAADFGLLDARGKLLGAPFQYRDRRTDGIPARLHARVAEEDLWAATGARAHPFSTLYQLHAMALRRSSSLTRAARVLLLPELLAYWFCGVQAAEHSLASTTQCDHPGARAWVSPVLARAGIPLHVFPPVVPPGTRLGEVLPGPARRTGLAGVQVVACAGHDIASAVAAVPAESASFAYVYAGPGSVVGAVAAAPIKSEDARRRGFTNEGGVDGAVYLHRCSAGLRVLKECRRAWARAGEPLAEDAVIALAAAGQPHLAAVDLDDPSLRGPDPVAALRSWCARTGQASPETRADLVRVVLESLAWGYRRAVRDLEDLLGRRMEVVHVIGEGARFPLLCQLTADACERPVLAGPADATAAGNVLAQAVASGACASWSEARTLVRTSFPPIPYEPSQAAAWDEAEARLLPHRDGGEPAHGA